LNVTATDSTAHTIPEDKEAEKMLETSSSAVQTWHNLGSSTIPKQCLLTLASLMLLFNLIACQTVSVKRYDMGSKQDPEGIPFHLTRPMKKITTTKYSFKKLAADRVNNQDLFSTEVVSLEIVNVVDTSRAFTINKYKAFFGETKFEFQRTQPGGEKGEASSTDLSVVKTEDKEGITEFLKGLVEGAKTGIEGAKQLKGAAPVPFALDENEADFFTEMLAKDILVVKTVSVDLQPVCSQDCNGEVGSASRLEELEELKRLKKISEEEYRQGRRRILEGI
jgi:hypothetical protein